MLTVVMREHLWQPQRTGLTFYDDEVARFFCPYAADESAIFMMALGKSVKHR